MEKRVQNIYGFTLIEAMVVILIIGILIGIGTSGFSRKIQEYRMSSAVRDLQSAVQGARMHAIKRGDTVGISFDLVNDQGTTFVDNGSVQQMLDADDTVLSTMVMPDGVDLYSLDSGATVIGFSGRGTLSFPLATERVELKNAISLYRGVSIRITGSSVVVRSSDNGNTWL